ncbi:hybrid sensor histidine kinase/response regulator [Ferrovibrio sp.]|uniref:hybrid sensor histidine kinase/response regulator n=1 Tax=Ferrovibrio sp. TaxID=1917215 RepID=UPI001B4DD927|nr:hybrid sensor histidine kinase/response regulator [Ferrovibrio sp.]MBP7062953.1 response regulator [Ferrovibrio sp.]
MRLPRFILNFAMLAILLLAAALNGYVHVFLRADAEEEEIAVMERLARIHGQDIESTLASIRYSLEKAALLHRIESQDGQAYHIELKRLENELSHVRAIGIADMTGKVRHSSRSYPPPNVSLADRDYVSYYIKGGNQPYFLSSPVRNIVDGGWQISMSVPLRDAGGQTIGVATAVIDPQQFGREFGASAAQGDTVTLLDRNFRMIARHPWREAAIGQSFGDIPAYARMHANPALATQSGLFRNPFVGDMRYAAVRRIQDGALVVSTSRAQAVALKGWRQLAWMIGLASAAIVLLAIAATWQARRRLESEARKTASLGSLNRQLQEQTNHAERLAAAKSEFLATMSHEIRTPMNGVLGMAQALQAMPLDPKAREAAEIITESATSLLAVINDVLDYSRLEAGKVAITPAAFKLRPLLAGVEALFTSAAQAKGLELRFDLAPDVPAAIVSDESRLRQMLVNLIGNAVKFTETGFVAVGVTCAAGPAGAAVLRFAVRDSGPGIAAEAQARIFDRFTQEDASTSRHFGGAGLGLAITRRLAELLGGRIGCDSRKGEGALFWIELPLQPAEQQAVSDGPAGARGQTIPAASEATPGAARLLCVDDNLVNRRTLQALLQPFGFQITLVESGEAALVAARSNRFDHVLLDIHMPGMDGFETLRALRKLPGTANARILAMTADVMPEAVLRYESAGFHGVVAKPLIIKDLISALAQPA